MPIKSEFSDAPLADEPYPERLLKALQKHAAKNPNRIAMVCAEDETKNISFKDLYNQTLSIAAFLEKLEFGRGDIACLVLSNCFEYLAIFTAATLTGGAISWDSNLSTAYELEMRFTDSNCKLVFCDETSYDQVLKAAKNCPAIKAIISLSKINSTFECPVEIYELKEIVQTQHNFNIPKIDYQLKKDLLLLPYSSGTSGTPKGVMLSHFNFGTAMNIYYKHLDEQIMTQLDPTWKWENESFLILGHMYHMWTFNTLNTLVLSGTKAIIMKQFDPAVFCRSIDKYKIRILMLGPPVLLFIAKDPIVDKYDLSSLELIITGGVRVGKDLIEEVHKRLPNVKYIVQGYGSTETSSVYLPILNNIQHASIGKLVSNLEQKIIDLETGNELPIGQIGEICIKSPSNMMGYFNNPMATEECLDPENWYKTGDIGYLDEEGFMYLVDRKKELLTVSGFRVAPAELEDVLLSKSDVRDCAVIGVPDGIIGEVPKAFVVKKNPNLTEQQVIEYVKEKLSPYKWLQGGVEFVQEIPKAPSGKVLRRILRDRERNKSMLDVLRV